MKPYIHAKNSVKKYGGAIEDYLEIHSFMDSSKAHIADVRHRAIFHHSFGIFIAEKVFGTYITNSEKKVVQVRDIAEDHVIEDLGFIPTVADYINNMNCPDWMGGLKKSKRKISYDQLEEDNDSIESDMEISTDFETENDQTELRKSIEEFKKIKKEMEEMNKFFPKEVPNVPHPWEYPRPYPDRFYPPTPYYPYSQPTIFD